MALFKVSIKQPGQYNGRKVEKGMEVEVPYNGFAHNMTGTVQGKELTVTVFQRKYGLNIKPLMGVWGSYLDIKQM